MSGSQAIQTEGPLTLLHKKHSYAVPFHDLSVAHDCVDAGGSYDPPGH